MTNITINEAKHSIKVTKEFYKKASIFGSNEYQELREARHDFPTFKVVIHKVTKRDNFKGLTFDYMKAFIEKHDDEKKTIMAEFKELRGVSEDAKNAFADSMSYGEIKAWFLAKYPAIEEFHKTRETRIQKVKEEREAKREAQKLVA